MQKGTGTGMGTSMGDYVGGGVQAIAEGEKRRERWVRWMGIPCQKRFGRGLMRRALAEEKAEQQFPLVM